MKTMIDFLKQLGLDTALIISGLAGGIASLRKMTKLKWWEKFISVLAGGFSANYLTPFVADFMNLTENALLGIAFLVGYGGLAAVEYWFNKLHSKKEKDAESN
jgi:predicted Rossmann fold nucleotide-binding protein DprA/Smf involved in DNA uptake